MTRSSRYILIAVVLIVVLGVGAIFGIRWLRDRNTRTGLDPNQMTATGDTPQTIENPDVAEDSYTTETTTEGAQATDPTVDNSDLKETLRTPEAMQKVIDENKDNINNKEVLDQLAPSYPNDLIPIYKAKSAADSSDIITVNGRPGWTATYGSDATVDDVSGFYQKLLSGQDGYTNNKSGEADKISAIVDNCTIEIDVLPNNEEQTGLSDKTNVKIFIERN